MNYILEAFTGMPVTISSAVIVISVVVVSLLSVVFLEAVKFIINQEAWKKEIVDSKVLLNKLQNILCNKSVKHYIKYTGINYYITPYNGKFIWGSTCTGLELKSGKVDDSWLKDGYRILSLTQNKKLLKL